jgi:hypothetical protein
LRDQAEASARAQGSATVQLVHLEGRTRQMAAAVLDTLG